MNPTLRVLEVEDSASDARLIERELQRGGFTVEARRVDTAESLAAALAEPAWDVILCDHNLPAMDSTSALRMVRSRHPETPFIIVSGSLPETVAAQAMQYGAHDFVNKDNLARLVPAIRRELADVAERHARREAERTLLAQAEDLRIGREIQQRLFPTSAPSLPNFDLAGVSLPAAATGGDYFDFIPMAGGCTAVVVGDVTGHGLGPALIMADARAYLRSLAFNFGNARDILLRANELLRADIDADRFVTLFFGIVRLDRHTFEYLNAGHPAGYVLDRTGAVKATMASAMPPLGLMPLTDAPQPVSLPLAPGDLLLLLTDGVLEAASPAGEEFELERVLAVVRAHQARPAAEIVKALSAGVQAFSAGHPQADDITIVIVKVSDPAPANG